MKKIVRFCSFVVSICIVFSALPSAFAFGADTDSYWTASENTNEKASESQLDNNDIKFQELTSKHSTINDIINDALVESCDYLYSMDDSADFIYMELSSGGYAIFLSQTMELLEYSPTGNLNYPASDSKKYYCGPGRYLSKESDKFVDISSGEAYVVSDETAIAYSESLRKSLIGSDSINSTAYTLDSIINMQTIQSANSNTNMYAKSGTSTPKIDDEPYITNLSIGSGTYVENFMYFLSDPQHGINSTGTCGAVAAQLLLSYHNYYSDRRIIETKYLNGSSDPAYRYMNPKYCEDPMSMDSHVLGSRGFAEDGKDVANSYFAKVVNEIPASATTTTVKNGIKRLLNENNIDYSISSKTGGWFLGTLSVNTDGIVSEIDEGRPAIILMQSSLGGYDHYVIAYGYQDYTYTKTSSTYSGFITHFGWGSGHLNVWINSAWCYSYITLQINHEHNYDTYVGPIGTTGGIEYKCSTCGHRTDKVITVKSSTRYTERVINLKPYTFKEYYVSFEVGGSKIIQTFGTTDTLIEVYDANGKLVDSDDDDGIRNNAFIRVNLQANTQYRIRVYFFFEWLSGSTKLVITPTQWLIKSGSTSIETINDIWLVENRTSYALNTSLAVNNTKVFRFVAPSTGTYTFETTGDYDSYVYVVDPLSGNLLTSSDFNDDDGEGQNARLSKKLTAGKTYLVFYSAYNIHDQSSNGSIQFRISFKE